MFEPDGRMSDNRQRWVKSWEAVPPVGVEITQFEIKVAELKLTPEQYAGSAELRAWATQLIIDKTPMSESEFPQPLYDVLYVPESLLAAWGIKTKHEVEFDEKEFGVVPFCEMVETGCGIGSSKE